MPGDLCGVLADTSRACSLDWLFVLPVQCSVFSLRCVKYIYFFSFASGVSFWLLMVWDLLCSL